MKTFQQRVWTWAQFCFGFEAREKRERAHRFLEEAFELGQACGVTEAEASQLLAYVYGRPVGDVFREVGGTMTTLGILCSVNGVDLERAALDEYERCISKTDEIRSKSERKPRGSPLPGSSEPETSSVGRPAEVKHVRGEWKVVRAGNVTVAQGYEYSCGVVGCTQNEYRFGVTDERSAEIMDAFAELRCAMTHEQESASITRVIEAVRAYERTKPRAGYSVEEMRAAIRTGDTKVAFRVLEELCGYAQAGPDAHTRRFQAAQLARPGDRRCTATDDGQPTAASKRQCVLIEHHDSDVNATPHLFERN